MAHHWNDGDRAMNEDDYKKMFSQSKDEPGATGKFPDGKIHPLDEGEIRMRIGVKDNNIIIDFGKPITFIGFTKEQALNLGQLIIEHALKMPK